MKEIVFDGRLTREEYSRWFMDNFERSHNPDYGGSRLSSAEVLRPIHARRIDPEFDHLSKSEFLLENFSMAHHSVQGMVELFLWQECGLDLIEDFVRLSLRVIDDNCGFDFDNDTNSDSEMSEDLMRHIQRNYPAQDVNAFEGLRRDFVILYSREQNFHLLEIVVLMLVLVHDLPFVVSILEKWTGAASPGSASDFVRVAERWEKDFDVLPIDWVTNIVRAEGSN